MMIDKLRTWLAAKVAPDKPVKDGERTGVQEPTRKGARRLATVGENQMITAPRPATIETWREMRFQPTIALARAVATGPIRTAKMGIERDEGVPEARETFIYDQLIKLWPGLLHDSIYAKDYGWQAFEKVFNTTDGGMQGIKRMKALLPEMTTVLLKDKTGEYNGLINGKRSNTFITVGGERGVVLPPEKTFWFVEDKEGDNWYGESTMERAREAYNSWLETDARNDRYMTSVAGPIPMVQYPPGEGQDETGQDTENFLTAKAILDGLSTCKGVAMPNILANYADDLLKAGVDPAKMQSWHIGFVEASGQHGGEFLDRTAAKERDFMRAWLVPERAATEGEHGTKAEAETHGDLVLVQAEQSLDMFVDMLNHWLVDQLLALNFGPQAVGTVRVTVEKIDRDKRQLLREIVKGTLGNPTNVDLLLDLADMETIFDMVGLPPATDLADKMKEQAEAKANPPTLPPMFPPQPPPQPEPDDEPADEDTSMALPDEPQDRDVAWLDMDGTRRYFEFRDGNWFSIEILRNEAKTDTAEEGETAAERTGHSADAE